MTMHGRTHLACTLAILAAFTASGCATSPGVGDLSPEQRSRLSDLEVHYETATRPHTVIEPIRSFTCHRNAWLPVQLTHEGAIETLKVKAVMKDADAISNAACNQSPSVDWLRNCWSSIVCTGDAIRYTD
jgi:hypothetical protein